MDELKEIYERIMSLYDVPEVVAEVVREISENYQLGLITEKEVYIQVIDIYTIRCGKLVNGKRVLAL